MSGPFGSGSLQLLSESDLYTYKVEQSMLFEDNRVLVNSGNSTSLDRSFSGAGNRKTYTFSFWVKRSRTGLPRANNAMVLSAYRNTGGDNTIAWIGFRRDASHMDRLEIQYDSNNGNARIFRSSMTFADTSAWYHIVIAVDTTQTDSNNRDIVYINGVPDFTGAASIASLQPNADTDFNDQGGWRIGDYQQDGYNAAFDGYLAEFYFIDGQQLTASAFGEFKNTVWVPKSYTGSYSGNSFYLNFSNSSNLGEDQSGNNYDWTGTLVTTKNQSLDSPTQNFATFNVLDIYNRTESEAGGTLVPNAFKGNLTLLQSNTSTTSYNYSTLLMNGGKWYAEFRINDIGTVGSGSSLWFGVRSNIARNTSMSLTTTSGDFDMYRMTEYGSVLQGNTIIQSSSLPANNSYSNGDIVGIALDLENGTLQYYKNGATNGSLITGLYTTYYSTVDMQWTFYCQQFYLSSGTSSVTWNFGQDSSFYGAVTKQGNGGDGEDFYYTPPSGFKALSTRNMEDETISPATGNPPEKHFKPLNYIPNNEVAKSITGVGFQPDMVWTVANGGSANGKWVTDVVRGVNKPLKLNQNQTETTDSTYITSFDADGFSIGTSTQVNEGTSKYRSYSFKAAGTGASNSQGSITATVSANTASGFAICKWVGTGANATVGHSLGQVPRFIMVKNLDTASDDWVVYMKPSDRATGTPYATGNNWGVEWIGNPPGVSNFNLWNDTDPTSSVFHLGSSYTNRSGDNYIAYVFCNTPGFSHCGWYRGDGVDATTDFSRFVPLPFSPAFIFLRCTTYNNNPSYYTEWFSWDNSFNDYRYNTPNGYAHVANMLGNNFYSSRSSDNIEFYSNGFRFRDENTNYSSSLRDYTYMAFAQMPGKYALGR